MSNTNELLTQEITKLRAEVDRLNQRCQLQETEQSAKLSAVKEAINSLIAQLKDVAEKLPYVANGQNGFHFSQENRKKLEPNNLESPEWTEQYDRGVYVTLMTFHDGTRDLRRVRFSRKIFTDHQAETWWLENRNKVYEKYNVRF